MSKLHSVPPVFNRVFPNKDYLDQIFDPSLRSERSFEKIFIFETLPSIIPQRHLDVNGFYINSILHLFPHSEVYFSSDEEYCDIISKTYQESFTFEEIQKFYINFKAYDKVSKKIKRFGFSFPRWIFESIRHILSAIRDKLRAYFFDSPRDYHLDQPPGWVTALIDYILTHPAKKTPHSKILFVCLNTYGVFVREFKMIPSAKKISILLLLHGMLDRLAFLNRSFSETIYKKYQSLPHLTMLTHCQNIKDNIFDTILNDSEQKLNDKNSKLSESQIKWLKKNLQKINDKSSKLSESHIQWLKKNLNVINLPFKNKVIPTPDISQKKFFSFGYVGFFSPHKNVHSYVNVANMVHNKMRLLHPDFPTLHQFYVMGSFFTNPGANHNYNNYISPAATMNLIKYVYFPSTKGFDAVSYSRGFQYFDFLFLTHTIEPYKTTACGVFIDAIENEKPLISYHYDFIKIYLDNPEDIGYFFDPYDDEKMADFVVDLNINKEKYELDYLKKVANIKKLKEKMSEKNTIPLLKSIVDDL